ncbi:MAG TPA: YebC/PmpR family DNA-binding transcriptional regulator [bacterium]|nr:YebC/PmpR family DNA-binding transcriptional regulator [bacterium]HOL96037.1 YebC/PmpR family DNA-binding transcriptional regulator [bacterium]HPP03069.1 YebC/PmpR family DNA-binding transcriptional regulator [bacterium]
MSGHSKWSTIKHKKAKLDAQRGKIFTKIIKELTVAARMGGGDPSANPRLRTAIDNARSANMPKDTMEKAIKKGTGELPGVTYEEVTYEAYGPGGTAIFVEVLSDNKNRTTSELRHLFSKWGGNLGESGCVAWIFQRRGMITLEGENLSEDTVMEAAIDAGALDVEFDEGVCYIYTAKEDLYTVKQALEERGFTVTKAELTRDPQNTVSLEGKSAVSMIKLLEALEDHDDVQNVYSNADIPDEVLEAS